MTNLLNYSFTLEESKHTQTGAKIFITRLTEKVDKEVFKTINTAIKKIGGYYSRFVTGFIFNEKPEQLNIVEATQTKTPSKKKTSKQIESLYDRVQFVEGDTNKSDYDYRTVGSNYNPDLSTKEIAQLIRKELKARFPEVKFSVRSSFRNINVELKQSPYDYNEVERNTSAYKYNEELKRVNPEVMAIIKYAKQLVKSYNYDDSDSMTDYFNTNFYSSIEVDQFDYIQIEQSEQIKQDIIAFRKQIELDKQAEEERKEVEYQEQKKQWELERIESEKRQQKEAKQIESINNDIEIKELDSNNQYFVKHSQFAKLNKNNTLDEYKEEVRKGEYNLQNVKITREIHFKSKQSLEHFSNLLLSDFDFLTGTGGSYTDDNRVNSMTDYHNMTEQEKATVEFYRLGAAIFIDGELQFLVDAQGYNYARYVGLVDNVTIEKTINYNQTVEGEELEELKEQAEQVTSASLNTIKDHNIANTWNTEHWKEYKKLIKEKLKEYKISLNKSIVQQIKDDSLKLAMYRTLREADPIQDQFKDTDVQQGQRLTIFRTSMIGVSTSHVIVDSVEYTNYAQYTDNVKLIFSQKGKRGLYQTNIHDDVLIYNGWIDIPKTLLYDIGTENGFSYEKTKFGSYDKEQYDLIIEHFKDQNILPIINTHKPIF